jgi:phosphoribosylglycinamide formyltransferase 1
LLKIGWFSTGRDKAARQLLHAVQNEIGTGGISGKIDFVFSNREPGEFRESDSFFELVRSYDIPLVCLSHRKFKRPGIVLPSERESAEQGDAKQARESWRLSYDREIQSRIAKFAPDICVLAGYMLIIGEELCQSYNMINLHPAPPGGPTGSWQAVIRKLLQDKAEKAGAMMHLVTPELDRGPVISYCTFSIRGKPFDQYWRNDDKDTLFRLIRQYELSREFPLIISTLKALGRGEINVTGRGLIDARGNSIGGYDLSSEINSMIDSQVASPSS